MRRRSAQAFATWANARLPTEAEWEYAARNLGTEVTLPWGDDEATCDRATMSRDGCVTFTTAAVCSRGPYNGLCDMAGNAWEWVSDWYGRYPSGAVVDPRGPGSGKHHVNRGGSWRDDARRLRASLRDFDLPADSYASLGFRLALSRP